MKWLLLFACSLPVSLCPAAERINHEGRILGPMPVVTNSVLFNTPEADAIVSGLQMFPRDNAWNEDISRRPLLTNSAAMIAQITNDLAVSRQTVRVFQEMNFVLVPDSQPLVPVAFTDYPDESDPSPYPIPSNTPVESWPSQTGSLSLFDWQRDVNSVGGDRHAILVQPGTGGLWETWLTLLSVAGGQSNWQAANGAKFSLNSNALRPLGWTSADAAGLSMFGGLIRYDECARGMVEHAIRLVVRRTRRAYIYPATHYASTLTIANLPAMGQRLRLKSSFVIPDQWSIQEKAVARALKKYGALVADNGGFFSLSAVPDLRWPPSCFANLERLAISNFEVIQSTGAAEGPRSPGAPAVDAGPDQTATVGVPITVSGALYYTNPAPITVLWKLYSGPGTVQISDPSRLQIQATFSTPGTYTLMLCADDGIHTPARDAVVIKSNDTTPPSRPIGLRIVWLKQLANRIFAKN
jgi:hypothetical protein